MEPAKQNHSGNRPSGLSIVLDILENSFDIVLLADRKKEFSYVFYKGNFREEISRIKKTVKENLKLKSESFSAGNIKFNVIKTGISGTPYLFTGILETGAEQNSLLWNSFYVKENPVFSPIAEDITGYSSYELNLIPGKSFGLVEEDEAERLKTQIAGFILNHEEKKLELTYKIRNKSGKQLWLRETILAERGNDGKIDQFNCSITDYTKLLEEKTALKEELENLKKLNQAKDQFISVLSHDLKSPYTSILGFSEILLNESILSQEERNEYLTYINTSSQNQLKLIDNLLEWSRLVTGRKKIEKYKLNMKTLVNNAISNNTRGIHQKNLQIKLTCDNLIYAEADERLIYEVLNIFISNAVKYSFSERVIEIHINRFRDNQVEVIIKDEGIGMSEKVKNQILKIESIVSLPGTGGEKGTGISLLLANEIIKAHNGEMWYYSEEGRGSEFHFTLPAASNLILIIDDDETEIIKITNMLKTGFPEFRCITEPNFYSALNAVRKKNPAAIIMEHKLPLMDGLEFIRVVSSGDKYSDVPIIIYSGEMKEPVKSKYLSAGVSDFLPKPVDLKLLKEKLEENLK